MLARIRPSATALPILLAALAALALPWLLVGLTTLPVLIILSLQLGLFVALAAMLCAAAVRVGLLPAAARRAIAHRAAMEQFMPRGIAQDRGRTGILIFVSLAERYARIVADEASPRACRRPHWQGASMLWSTTCGRAASPTASSRRSNAAAACWRRTFPRRPRSEASCPTGST